MTDALGTGSLNGLCYPMVARLIPGVGRVLTHLLQSCPAEHSWEQIPSPVALFGATVYFVVPQGGCMQ